MRRASTKTREVTPKVAVQHMTSFMKFRACVTLDEIYVDRRGVYLHSKVRSLYEFALVPSFIRALTRYFQIRSRD